MPLLVPAKFSATVTDIGMWHVIQHLEIDVLKAQDNLVKAKISQSFEANMYHTLKFAFSIGSHLWLSSSLFEKIYSQR